jgi:Leucine-rich repeat (LRR) protein
VTYLNLFSNGIQKIENCSLLVNLKTLILSFNEIKKIEGLGDLHCLEKLDLGNFQVETAEY